MLLRCDSDSATKRHDQHIEVHNIHTGMGKDAWEYVTDMTLS